MGVIDGPKGIDAMELWKAVMGKVALVMIDDVGMDTPRRLALSEAKEGGAMAFFTDDALYWPVWSEIDSELLHDELWRYRGLVGQDYPIEEAMAAALLVNASIAGLM